MNRDIKTLLSVSCAAIDQPSTSITFTNLDLSLDVRVDDGVSDDAEDDSIPFV